MTISKASLNNLSFLKLVFYYSESQIIFSIIIENNGDLFNYFIYNFFNS
jgi:hypothetical protein